MTNAFKKAFTGAVAVLTMFWSIGLSALVVPMQVNAATEGDLIKGTTLSTVYYYGTDGYRYAFPNEKTYFTWYEDFSDVETISDSDLAAISLAGNVVYRPGSRWIKIESDPKTYAVTTEGTILWIETEEVAEGLAGSDWNAFIDDVSDTFFVDYTVGTSLMSAEDAYDGALVADGDDTYLVWGGEYLLVTDDGFDANRLQTRFVLDGSGVDLSGMTAGDDLDAEDSELTDTAQLGGETASSGGLSVSMASDTAASATLPAGAASVPFATFELTATDGDVTVDQMIVKLGGIGDVNNLPDVYLYEGDTRLTDGRSLNTSTREVTYSSMDLLVEDGETVYVTARADIAADPTAGDTAYLYLADEDSVVTDGSVSGDFPVAGNSMTFSDTPAGTVNVDESGTISDTTVGTDDATIAKFTIAADDEDATVERIALTVDNASDHTDYKLLNGDETLATGVQSEDLVTFTLTEELVIEDGDDELFKVTADIGGESDDTISVAIDEAADVSAIGSNFGFNLDVNIDDYDDTGAACVDSTDNCSISTILGGELTFAFNGPSSDDIQVDGTDVTLMDFTLTTENWVEIKDFDVIVEDDGEDLDDTDDSGLKQTDEDPNLTDICIREADGSVWMGPEEIDGSDGISDRTQTLTFTDDQVLEAGDSLDLLITADVDGGAPAAEVYHVEIDMSTVTAEDSNGDELVPADDIVPTSDIIGNDFTTTASSLEVTVSTPPSDGATYVKGASSVSVVAFSFEAGSASDATITELTVTAQGDGDGALSAGDIAAPDTDLDVGDYVSSCSLYDNQTGSLVDGPESADSDEEFLYDSFDWTIEAGETAKLVVKCNLSNTDTNGGDDDAYVFYVGAAADITAEDSSGDAIDGSALTLSDGNGDDDAGDVNFVVTNSGELSVALSGDTATSTIILGSSTGVSMSKYKFTATDEAFVVKKVTLYNCDEYTADDDCSDGGEAAGADDVAAAVYISYTNSDGETETKTGYLAANYVTFDNMDMYVPTTEYRYLTVTVDTNTVSSTGATSGDVIQLNFDTETADAEFEAVGASSSETIDEADAADPDSVAAYDMTVRKSKPTISLASGSPSGASIPGLGEVFRFNVAADSRGFVTMEKVTFKVTSTDNAGTPTGWADCDDTSFGAAAGWALYDSDDTSTELGEDGDWAFYDSAGANCGASNVMAWATLELDETTDNSEEIGAGETKTYILKVDTTGASSSSDDSFRIDIETEANVEAGTNEATDAFEWDDADQGTDLEADMLKNLPVTGGTLVY